MVDLVVLDPEQAGEGLEALLDRLRERVRAGEMSALAVAYILRDGRPGATWSKIPNFAALLGAVYRLAHKLQVEKDGEDAA